ncbi:polysaccharide deacetylase family protein [Clostridium sp. HMP27]|uniref:polysaccharide deacetylase family protein n=1 Tax=Clostridium sp. HMP27 TaxID=1487921 RepID=UPI000690B2B8|nr:polysaccharide deacetylase family protein [Clostridium sp. HMP27]
MIKLKKTRVYTLCFIIVFVAIISTKLQDLNVLYAKDKSNPLTTYDAGDPNYNKTVYLTFDDGPTYIITDKLLDVLKENNVKATFFVVGKEIEGREDILKRIHNEGHSIGLHTYSHNFKSIYSSKEIFIEEMEKVRSKVKDIINVSPSVIRFPGGSSNHLTQDFLVSLHEHNFKVYDWNVDLSDGVNPNLTTNKLVQNAKKYKQSYSRLIVLLHCNSNNKNTVKALPHIIRYYKGLGYEFKVIDNNTEEYYYKLKK